MEERHSLDLKALPDTPQQISAASILEDTRRRVIAEAVRFARWIDETEQRVGQQPWEYAVSYAHGLLKKLAVSSGRKAERPTTVQTWFRLLQAAFPDQLGSRQESAHLARYVTGLRARAPAAPVTERGMESNWARAVGYVASQLDKAESVTERRTWMALWLVLHLQVAGMRPLAALRGPLKQSKRHRLEVNGQGEVWSVEVLLDKDNKVGTVPAARKRQLQMSEGRGKGMLLLPYPNDTESVRRLVVLRREVKKRHGIADLRSARRDAMAWAEGVGLDPGAVGNHRPGSRATPVYTNTLTSTALQVALRATRLNG